MRDLLYEITPLDPAVFATVAATLLAVPAFACIVPAWRASGLDPMQASPMHSFSDRRKEELISAPTPRLR